MSTQLTHKDFAECLNDRFSIIDAPSAPQELTLVEVSDELVTSRQVVFSIVFRGPKDKFMPQQTYKLNNNRLGEREIFLVPIGKDDMGYQYQAVFNYLTKST